MKTLVYLMMCCGLALAGARSLRGQELDRVGAIVVDPLAPAERDNWKKVSGVWDFDKGVLTGSGSSRIDYTRQFLAPVRITFDLEVIDGVRPRGYFGRYTLAHEGFNGRLFGVYPSQGRLKKYRYEAGRKYPVKIEIEKQRMEVRIDAKIVDSRDVGMEALPSLGLSSGDDYSQGMSRFSNMRIEGVPSAATTGH